MLQVPAFGRDEHYWVAEPDGMTSRARMAEASGPYFSAVPPEIADWSAAVPADLAADAEEAAAALSRFDAYSARVLGITNPMLGPMSAILLRTESVTSSQIENITAGARQVALAEIGQSSSANAKTVVANVRAMEAALALAGSLRPDAVLRMHRALLSGQPGWESHAGRWRDRLVWVGTSSVTPRGAAWIAPQADLVPAAMDDLMTFVRRDDLPVITQAAIAHAHFESIHPFADGNGRTGRALVHSMLRAKGLLPSTTAPVSAGLLRDTASYFRALDAYRTGDARPVVASFAAAGRFAASSGERLVDALAAELDHARTLLGRLRPQAAAWRVLPHLVAHPVVNARSVVQLAGLGDQSAQNALGQLADAGVLEERTGLQRNRVWQHPGILGVLDAYAQSLTRR